MASPAANAERYVIAQRDINSAIARIAQKTGVPDAPPIGKFYDMGHRHALESDRLALFLRQLADKLDQPKPAKSKEPAQRSSST